MARRGYHDLSKIRTCPITAGAFGPPEDDRRRMVRVLAFVMEREHDLAWAHPVDGLAAYVDLIEKKVFKVTDEFELPVPAESGDYDDEAVRGPHRTTLKPIEITQPEGPSFTLDGYALRWQDWSMRIGFDAREGLTLHQVSLARPPGALPGLDPGDGRALRRPEVPALAGLLRHRRVPGRQVGQLARAGLRLPGRDRLPGRHRHRRHRPAPHHTERHLHPRGRLRHLVEAHRHLQRLGPVPPPAPARGLLLHHGGQLRLRLLLVLLPGRHDRARGQGDRRAVHLGLPRRRAPVLHRGRARPGRARCTSTCSARGWT